MNSLADPTHERTTRPHWLVAGNWVLTALILVSSAAVARPLAAGAAIASAHPFATQAGVQILSQGGNAFDAAVAVAATLAVVEPSGSGLGGGGFWMLHRARDGREVMVDGRERAPLAAHADFFLDGAGRPLPGASIDGPLAAGIPGLPATLAHVAERYGALPLSTTLQPAIAIARNGFAVGEAYCRAAARREKALRQSPAAARIFLDHGRPPRPGFRLVQTELAHTLEALAEDGADGFYRGAVGADLVKGVRAAGGRWATEDLAAYRVIEREPLRGEYRGVRIVTAAPPGGGVVLLETLNILAEHELNRYPPPIATHVTIEAMRRAYRDRDRYLGDPDFIRIPLTRLLSRDYAAGLNAALRTDRALPSAYLPDAAAPEGDGANTTHLSIVDREGNAVAATLSINYGFGSGFVAPGTGVLLNDEMDDFATLPGVPNVYGLVGGEANRVAPGKRMLSSMTPTFLDDRGRFAVLGTPGGSRIISMVLLATLDFADGRGPHWIASRPRFHHQYLPDQVELEPDALPAGDRTQLTALGHRLQPLERPYGNLQIVVRERDGRLSAASDPRGEGLSIVIP
ncbi:gamma-glutamyltransferase [Methylotetracoccus oryzae]|uniref:gamma-glutamyltransferase n=1 Tax=Methylotetracoccus oryzae TaxID=1919059 RepID=UPI00111ABCF3|nr:gamma-glutamyltransferase [Methylotetracoccus oryzae]